MPFDAQSTYSKFQDCDTCGSSEGCGCNKSDDCGCCPAGLVSVTDDCGKNIGCLSPNDKAELEIASHIPPLGYIKAFDPATGAYLGDLTPDAWIDYQAALDATITPVPAAGLFNPTTQEAVSVTAILNNPATVAFNYSVDRESCTDAILVTMSVATAGITFLSGLSTFVMASTESVVAEGIMIDDTVAVGAYVVTITYSGCSNNFTKEITLNVL